MTVAPGLPLLADEAILAQFLETTDLGFEEVGGLLEQARVVLDLAHEMSDEFATLYPTWVYLDQYYRGTPPLPSDPQRLSKKYKELHQMSRSNWMGLVVDVVNERLQISSISSTANPVQEKTAWKWWQANNMDGVSPQIHNAALKYGMCYVSVWPNADGTPRIMGESPMNCHVRYDPETGVPSVAFRVWQDNVCGCVYADLITDAYVYRLTTGDVVLEQIPFGYWETLPTKTITVDLHDVQWHFRADVPPVARNPQREVPYTRMLTEPDLIGGYRSEIAGLIPIQDRINKTNFDRLMAQAFASFPRAWITGIDIPTDPDGRPKEPFDAAVDRLWTIENENAKIGQLDAAELDGYIRANTADVQALATQSRTPPHYLISGMGIFPSGESVRATEYGLSRKCQSRQQSYGDGWSDILRRCGKVSGNKRLANDLSLNVVWADVEARSEGELVDALIKMGTLGVPWPALWQRWGASPEEIAAWDKLLQDNAALAQAQQLAQASQKPLMRQLATQAPQISTAGDLNDNNPLT
jgi:hypothetical protein